MTKVDCWDCGGSGYKSYYQKIDNGICYTCKGSGVWYQKPGTDQDITKRQAYVQGVADKKQLAALYTEYKQLEKDLAPVAAEYTFSYLMAGIPAPSDLEAKLKGITDRLTAVRLEGEAIQARVHDIKYKEFSQPHIYRD